MKTVNSKQKILLVDDEIELTELVAKRIRWAGYEVVCHYRGSGTVEVVQQQKPDLILLDLKLPDISGVEIYKLLKDNPSLGQIPVIFLSALHEEEENCLLNLKAQGFLRKPCDSRLLIETIKSVLPSLSA